MTKKEKRFIEEYEQSKNTYSKIPDIILCCGDFLSAEEVRMWSIVRRRVPNNRVDGYYKVPTVPTDIKYFAEKMGCSQRNATRILGQLQNKSLLLIKRQKGKKNIYQLVNLDEVVAWYKKWQGGIRSIKFSTKRAEKHWQNQYLKKKKD